jgi:hypothetical protein
VSDVTRRRIITGFGLGLAAGFVDVAPMVEQDVPPELAVPVLVRWVAVGLLAALARHPRAGAARGALVSFLTILPEAVRVAYRAPLDGLPMVATALVLGAIVGLLLERFAPEGGATT